MIDYHDLLGRSNRELAKVDPLVMNLLVAKSIPSLASLEVPRFEKLADDWADMLRKRLATAEPAFWRTPQSWKSDINFFRLVVLGEFLERQVGIAYKEDQRAAKEMLYTDPADLFLNGVMETRRGTCGNMAVLQVVLGWRLGWPVSLACVGSHFICRYDDGKVTHNIEATQPGSGFGGVKSDPDDQLMIQHGLPRIAITCGSDLRALKPRELLGVFIGLRGRHMLDSGKRDEAETDFLLARYLFPSNRRLYLESTGLTIQHGSRMFDPGEHGSPQDLAEWIGKQYGKKKEKVLGVDADRFWDILSPENR